MTITLREYAIAITLVALAQTSYIAGDLLRAPHADTSRINAAALQSDLLDSAKAGLAGGAIGGSLAAKLTGGNTLSSMGSVGNIGGSGMPDIGSLTDKLGSVGGGNPMNALQNTGGAGDALQNVGGTSGIADKAQSIAGNALKNVDVSGMAGKAKDMLGSLGGGSNPLGALGGMLPEGFDASALTSNPAAMADVQKCIQQNTPQVSKVEIGSFGVTELPSGATDALGAVKGAASNATSDVGNPSDDTQQLVSQTTKDASAISDRRVAALKDAKALQARIDKECTGFLGGVSCMGTNGLIAQRDKKWKEFDAMGDLQVVNGKQRQIEAQAENERLKEEIKKRQTEGIESASL